MIKDKIELDKDYITKMGLRVVLHQVGVMHPGTVLLHEASVTGLVIKKEESDGVKQVSHYMEWDEYGCNADSLYNLVLVCTAIDDAIIDHFYN